MAASTEASPNPNTAVQWCGRCLHADEVLIRIDLDEIGEPDDTPTLAMVCLGCEAIRWI
jgi:hypothetical protein